MCWNWKVSLGSFVVISLISYSLFMRNLNNDRLLSIYLLSYGSMQLFETFIWLGQDKKYIDLNKIGSIFASALLYCHPLAFIIGMWYDKKYKAIKSGDPFKLFLIIGILWVVYGLYKIASAYKNKSYSFLSHPDPKSGHLVWEFPDNYRITMIIILCISLYFIIPFQIIFSLMLGLYFMLPILLLHLNMNVDDKNKLKNYRGSYWCWYVAIFSFLFYAVNPLLQ
jgi:hypothetical protein